MAELRLLDILLERSRLWGSTPGDDGVRNRAGWAVEVSEVVAITGRHGGHWGVTVEMARVVRREIGQESAAEGVPQAARSNTEAGRRERGRLLFGRSAAGPRKPQV